ncbi:MAG: sulfatase [Phycisphaerae bacterium]
MRPNILYIHSHDTGRYVQPYGYAIPTPNIQRLATQGVLFRQAFCAGPTCSASRAALLTGQCPHSSGMIGLAHRGFALKDYRQHIVHTLHAAGYESAMVGQQHVSARPEQIGYQRILSLDDGASGVTAAAVEFLREKHDKPFWLSVGYFETHRPFHKPGPAEDDRYCRPPAPLPDAPQTRADMAAFMASARVLDANMGQVFAALDDAGLADSTLVICTTDHGIAFPLMKCNLTDHGMGVMLIIRGPGGFSAANAGRACDAMVSHIDIFPTICELVGIDRPAWLQGRSIMPLIDGRAGTINDEVFGEVTYHAAYEPMRAVRTTRWKYIRRHEERTSPVLPNCDNGPSKDLLVANGWRERPPEMEQLYDLALDPNESCNLLAAGRAADPALAPVLTNMRRRLDDWMRRTDDPILKGLPVPAPSGAKVSGSDGFGPEEGVRTIP